MGLLNKIFGIEKRLKNKALDLTDICLEYQKNIGSKSSLTNYLDSQGILYKDDYDGKLTWIIILGIDRFICKLNSNENNVAENYLTIRAEENPLNQIFLKITKNNCNYIYASPYHQRPDTISEYCTLFLDGFNEKGFTRL